MLPKVFGTLLSVAREIKDIRLHFLQRSRFMPEDEFPFWRSHRLGPMANSVPFTLHQSPRVPVGKAHEFARLPSFQGLRAHAQSNSKSTSFHGDCFHLIRRSSPKRYAPSRFPLPASALTCRPRTYRISISPSRGHILGRIYFQKGFFTFFPRPGSAWSPSWTE